MYNIKRIQVLSISLLITYSSNAQQIINPNIKHDWADSRYIVYANDTVLDSKTNLIWKKCPQGLTDSSCSTGNVTTHNWQQALDLAVTSTFAGFSDWRLPNIKELRSIAAYDRYNPAINIAIFPNTPSSNYFWSSSPRANNFSSAWSLSFYHGNDLPNSRSNYRYVRLVRFVQ